MAGCIACQRGGSIPAMPTFPAMPALPPPMPPLPPFPGPVPPIPPYPQQEKIQYSMLDWNINPRTGQSMNMIQGPYGSIAANIFLSMPKEMFFMNSDEYCCNASAQVNYVNTMAMMEQNLTKARNAYSCCWRLRGGF